VSMSTSFMNSGRLGKVIQAACRSCRWSVCVASVVSGAVFMALAAYFFLASVLGTWSSIWVARIIASLVFATLPTVLYFIVRDFRETGDQARPLVRWTRAGLTATFMGLLELVLAFSTWFMVWIVLSSVTH
jgi:hypothetical protein